MTEIEQIQLAVNGDKDALEQLILSVQGGLYNLAVRMVWHPQDAEDASQEIMIKIITKLSTFQGNSSFRTWAWRIAINHLLNMRKKHTEQQDFNFDDFAIDLDNFVADNSLPVDRQVEQKLLIEEAKIGCLQAMLQCLKRDERAAYIVGEIFGVTDKEGATIFDIQPAAYRKRLSRARQRIHEFMNRKCGLYNPTNPCRCSKRLNTAIVHKRLDPNNLLFAKDGDDEEKLQAIAKIDAVDRASALYRTHPTYDVPEILQRVLNIIE